MMADAMPDYFVEQQKLVVQEMTLKANLERTKLEIMQLDSRKESAKVNMQSTLDAIKECEKKRKGLEDTHGKSKDISGDN